MLLCHTDVPVPLRRPHILKGYRPPHQPLDYYFKSAFFLHNEVINVWTHALPLIFMHIFYVVPELLGDKVRLPLLFLYFGISCLLMASALHHLMHSRSSRDHTFYLFIDFSGIAIFSLTVGVQRLSCRQEEKSSSTFTWFYLSSLIALVVGQYVMTCSLYLLRPNSYWRHLIRLISYLAIALWLYIPLYDRYTMNNWHFFTPSLQDNSIHLHNKAAVWLLLSGVFMGVSIPECFFPGRYDLIGYSHQIFHVCIVMVVMSVADAAIIDC